MNIGPIFVVPLLQFSNKVIYLNANLKHLRGLANLTLSELSNQTELSMSALASYEDRAVTPKMDSLLHLLDFYNEHYGANLSLDRIIREDLVSTSFRLPKPIYISPDQNEQASSNTDRKEKDSNTSSDFEADIQALKVEISDRKDLIKNISTPTPNAQFFDLHEPIIQQLKAQIVDLKDQITELIKDKEDLKRERDWHKNR